jgi:hypothetical protein
MKIVIGLMAVFAAALMIGTGGALLASVQNYRTQEMTDQYVVTTAGVTNSTIQLSSTLFESNKTLATVASNTTIDAPVLGAYVDASRSLNVTNLATNTTRTLTLNYRTAGLTDYPQAETASKSIPVIAIAGILIVIVGACVYMVLG